MIFKKVTLSHLLLITAIALSGVAAFYSIAGLCAIFAAAVVPIAIMGSTLEVAKLVVASWLYQHWNTVNRLLRVYFVLAIAILMLLTSMGIFGFLSKAHLDQAIPSGEVQAQVSLLDEKIKTQRDTINDNRTILRQLDEAVNQTMSRSTSETGADRAVSIRRSQAKERAQATKSIDQAQATINKLQEERAPVAATLREVEAEVGPIKYIAALIYNDTDTNMLEKAVRIVILMIVLVFDPLAVLMFIAYNSTLKGSKDGREVTEDQEGSRNNDQHDRAEEGSQEEVLQAEGKETSTRVSRKPRGSWGYSRDRQLAVPESTTEAKPVDSVKELVKQPIVVLKHLNLTDKIRIGDKVRVKLN